MKIGIVGAGNVGIGIGGRLAAKGHSIMVSFGRTAERVAAAAAAIGHDARGGTPPEAARFGDVVIVATPWAATLAAVGAIAHEVGGKVVWDTTNPLAPDLNGLVLGTTTSAGEQVAASLPGAHVVKAIPPFADVLRSPSATIGGQRPGVFVCGDDPAARQTVLTLVDDLGAAGIDAGPLMMARYAEPLGMLLVQLAYRQGMGSRLGTALLRD